MGNLIINLGNNNSTQDNPASMEIYRDVSTISERKTVGTLSENGGRVVRKKEQRLFQAKDVNVRAVFNSIRNIFSWIQGERILNPDFGSKLRYYLYEGITPQNKEKIATEIRGVCLKWEPRVNIERITPVNSSSDADDNTVQLDIVFTIPSLSDKQYLYSYIYNRTQ